MEKYSYLKKYTWDAWRERGIPRPFYGQKYNAFSRVAESEIEEAETKLGFQFPSELREFYLEVGYGHLVAPYNAPEDYYSGSVNDILPPLVLADFYKPIGYDPRSEEPEEPICDSQKTEWMAREIYDYMPEGSLPFFHQMDSCRFLMMLPHSENPNAVWWTLGGIKIEDSFERFIWRLYYEDPAYFDEIIANS